MKNLQKGFAIIPLIIILALLVIGGGTYIVLQNKSSSQNTPITDNNQTVFTGTKKTFLPEKIVSIDPNKKTFVVNYESRQAPFTIPTEFSVISETTIKKENDLLNFNQLVVNDVVWIRAYEKEKDKYVAKNVIITNDWRSSQVIIKKVDPSQNKITAEVFLPPHRRGEQTVLTIIPETEIRKGKAEDGQNRKVVGLNSLAVGDIASVVEVGFGVHPADDKGPFYATEIDVVSPYYCEQYLKPTGCIEKDQSNNSNQSSSPTVQQNNASQKKSYCTSENYTVKSGVEYWGANPMKADPATFEVLPRFPDDGGFDLCLSQDANNLFSAERIVAPRPQRVSYLQLQGTNNCKAYRVVDGVGVFEGVFLLSGSDARTFVDLTPVDGEKQGMCYGKDKNQVYSAYGVGGFGPIVGADPQTFKILNANYTKDANHVWNRGNPITNADAGTFVASGELWAKDKNNVYHWDKIISGADTTTFVALDDDHGKDATHAFDPFGNVFNQIADVSSLTSVNGFWLKDKFHVYTNNGQILDQAGPLTFADLGSGYGRDVSHVFYGNTGTFGSSKGNIIPEADLTSFMVVADNYGKDNAHIFSIGKVLLGADVNSFARISESPYFKDKSHVWYRGDGPGGLTLIPEADPNTFVFIGSYGEAKDANHTYGFSAKGFFYVK